MLPAPPPDALGKGTLFVVSLPIGDPEDITLRALRVLGSVPLIVAENATFSRPLLASYAIETPMVSLRPRNGVPALAAALTHLRSGQDVALIADSGTPTIVDPGLRLVQAALQGGFRVTPLPGATACMAALAVSGFSASSFRFLGLPPRTPAERRAFFTDLSATEQTLILYESHRYLRATLSDLNRCLEPTRKMVVMCDITHTTERIFRGTIPTVQAELASNMRPGAYTLVISGVLCSANA